MSDEIDVMIDWHKTPQGYKYWKKWYDFLKPYKSNFELKADYITSFILCSDLPIELMLQLHNAIVDTNDFGRGAYNFMKEQIEQKKLGFVVVNQ